MIENQKLDVKKAVTGVVALIGIILAAVVILHVNEAANPTEELVKKIVSVGVIVVGVVFFAVAYDKITVLPVELYQNRKLIWKLAKNDFKRRYVGSYMGIIWAFVQPIVTIGLYYVVFGMILNSARSSGDSTPFVLFLTAGMVPWFFFNEILQSGTNALMEYSYLVKKVVFKISILPIIKAVAACFTHLFFILLLLILSLLCGYKPSVYTLQIFYYSGCCFIFTLALCYTTCSIIVFFRDLGQIINIMLQILVWATPIMWNIDMIKNPAVKLILKINPMFYVVNGYRDAVYGHRWFFEDFFSTVYFWVMTALIFVIGAVVFKRLKVHFADVL
ncbi:MAG: ABC transporter permease [Lachnospiraceae bacterium]|nr:ABC transporter permease [Lachnospiraceae bacterium]